MSHIDADAVRRVLRGHQDSLINSFNWEASHQGYEYWRDRSWYDREMSQEDIAFLVRMLITGEEDV